MQIRKMGRLAAPALALAAVLSLMPRPALSGHLHVPLLVDVADGYVLEEVCPGIGFAGPPGPPTSMAFALGKPKEELLYVSYLFGAIWVLDLQEPNCDPWELVPLGEIDSPMGLAVHPKTGDLYVSHRYKVNPAGGLNVENVRSRISIVDGYTGELETFVENLPGLIFGELVNAIPGSQGITFDSYGNLYIAQGVNELWRVRWELCDGFDTGGPCAGAEPNDQFQSGVLKIDKDGFVEMYASGQRSPYDLVVAKEDKHGVAEYLYAGDNGEGDFCEACVGDEATSWQYNDELNLVMYGKDYGWPQPQPEDPTEADPKQEGFDHIGPLWNFGRTMDKFGDDHFGDDVGPITDPISNEWPVPTGITMKHGDWGELQHPLFMAMFNCPSANVPDLGTIEVFTGLNRSERTVLAQYVDGPIDLVMRGKSLYFAEFGGFGFVGTRGIYKITPE